jgi:hypothetical protein
LLLLQEACCRGQGAADHHVVKPQLAMDDAMRMQVLHA